MLSPPRSPVNGMIYARRVFFLSERTNIVNAHITQKFVSKRNFTGVAKIVKVRVSECVHLYQEDPKILFPILKTRCL